MKCLKIWGILLQLPCAILFVLNVPGYAPVDAPYPFLSGYALLHGFYAIISWILAGIVIQVFYNGKKSEKSVPECFQHFFQVVLFLLSGTFIGFVEYSVFLIIRIHRLELIKRFVEASNQKFGT